MDIFGILDLDPDPHENLCGSETLTEWGIFVFNLAPFDSTVISISLPVWIRVRIRNMDPDSQN